MEAHAETFNIWTNCAQNVWRVSCVRAELAVDRHFCALVGDADAQDEREVFSFASGCEDFLCFFHTVEREGADAVIEIRACNCFAGFDRVHERNLCVRAETRDRFDFAHGCSVEMGDAIRIELFEHPCRRVGFHCVECLAFEVRGEPLRRLTKQVWAIASNGPVGILMPDQVPGCVVGSHDTNTPVFKF